MRENDDWEPLLLSDGNGDGKKRRFSGYSDCGPVPRRSIRGASDTLALLLTIGDGALRLRCP